MLIDVAPWRVKWNLGQSLVFSLFCNVTAISRDNWHLNMSLNCTSPLAHWFFSINTCTATTWSRVGFMYRRETEDTDGWLRDLSIWGFYYPLWVLAPILHAYWGNTVFHKWKYSSLSHVQLFVTPWTRAQQAPLSMGFPRQEYWSGLSFPFAEDLPDPGIKPRSLVLQEDSFPSDPPRKPHFTNSLEQINF